MGIFAVVVVSFVLITVISKAVDGQENRKKAIPPGKKRYPSDSITTPGFIGLPVIDSGIDNGDDSSTPDNTPDCSDSGGWDSGGWGGDSGGDGGGGDSGGGGGCD